MSELLYQWLNDEVQLSQRIENFERDFTNGYLFGELLSKYNQQLNFDEFENKQLRSSKIKNFQLLQPTFKTLNIDLNTQDVDNIIKGKAGVANDKIYQLKMVNHSLFIFKNKQLEKVNDPADLIMHSKNGKYNAIVPLKRIQQPKEQFDRMEAMFFERRLNEMNKAQKQVNQEQHLEKFERFKSVQEEKLRKLKEKDEQEQRTLKEEMRKIQLNKLQRNMAFMEDWNQKGIENWRKNQDVRKKNFTTDLEFKTKIDDKRINRLQQLHQQTKVEMVEQIDQFENGLQKMGIAEVDDESGNRNDQGVVQQLQQSHIPQGSMSRNPQSKVVSEILRKERDKRRRKMIVDQAKQHGELQRREAAVLEKLKQQSRQEKEILYEVWRAYQCKSIIIKDRLLRDEKYRQKYELNVINIKYKEEEMLRIIKQEYATDLDLQVKRERELKVESRLLVRQQNYEECQKLVNYLFEFAEQCQVYLQNSDMGELGQQFLDESYKLFIEGKPLPLPKCFRTYDPISQLKLQESYPNYQDQKSFLCTTELQDYLHGQGSWVPHHHAILGEGQHQGDPTLDEKYVPDKPLNNYYLGNIVRTLIETKFPQTKSKVVQVGTLPFRCSLIGYAFCGKRSISELLARKYGIEIIGIESVVNELMEYYRRWKERQRQQQGGVSPTLDNQQYSQKSQQTPSKGFSNQDDQLSRAPQSRKSNQRDIVLSRGKSRQSLKPQSNTAQPGTIGLADTFWDQQLLDLAEEVHKALLGGHDVPDELYVKAICFKMKHLFPPKSQDEIYEEYLKSQEDFSKGKNRANNNKEDQIQTEIEETELEGINREDFHKQNLQNLKHSYTKGWLLYDFPHSYEQAKLLEKYLTGNQPQDQNEKTELEQHLESASLVVKPTSNQIVPRKPSQGGVSVVFHLDMQNNQYALKRALGRRYDVYTHSYYHLEDNIPPVDNAPLIERLESVYEMDNMQQKISDKNTYFDSQTEALTRWYNNFAHQSEEIIRKEVTQEGEQLSYQEVIGQKKQSETSQQEPLQRQQSQKSQQRSQKDLDIVQSDQPKPTKIIEESITYSMCTLQKVDASQRIEDVFFSLDQIVSQMLEISEKQILTYQQEKQREEFLAIQQIENDKQLQLLETKWIPTTYSVIVRMVDQAFKKEGLNPKVTLALYGFWERIEKNYLKHSRSFLKNTKEQREVIQVRLMDIQQKFIDLLMRHDEKFYLARNFQEEYNQFVSDNPDMLEEDQTKEELFQRVEDLADLLSDLIDQKKDDALEERKKTIESMWIEGEMERYHQEVQRLLQSELDRGVASIQLINEYYTQLDGRELSDIPENIMNQEIITNQETLPPLESLEDPNIYPRLEKLIAETLRIFNGEEEIVDDKNKKGGKAPKKEDKKAPAKKGAKEIIEEIKRDPTQIEIEGIKAVNTEKAIFRYRVYLIRDQAINQLKQIRSLWKKLCQKVEDWCLYTHKCEVEATQTMCNIFRTAIEQEDKIQKEVQLKWVDVVISHEVLNFLTPVPPPLPAREPTNEARLSISQLYHLIEDLRAITTNQLTIDSKQLSLVLARKGQGLQSQDLCDALKVSTNDWFRAIAKIQQNGYVPVRTVCSFFILLSSPIINQKERQAYAQALQQNGHDGMIDKDSFVNTEAWFDSYESVPEPDNTNYFDRAVYIKELLFFVHKDPDNELVNIQTYLEILRAKNQGQAQTYYEYLFEQQ